MQYWQLFFAFFRVGLFSVGGGYVLIPLIEREVVTNYLWLTNEEFLEVLGVTQGIPGAISIKFATFTGYRIAGIPGILIANTAVILPPVIFMLILSGMLIYLGKSAFFNSFLRGVQFASIGLLFSVTIGLAGGMNWETGGFILTALAVVLLTVYKLHPGLAIVLVGLLGSLIIR